MSSSTWLNKSTSTDFRINELMLKQEVNNIMASHSIFPDDFPVDVPTRYLSAVLRMYSSHDYECDLSKWIPLNAEMMRKPENAGRRYLEFERRLQEKGLIEKRPNNYLKGKYSCHFRFTSFFVEGLCSLIRLSLLINFKKYEVDENLLHVQNCIFFFGFDLSRLIENDAQEAFSIGLKKASELLEFYRDKSFAFQLECKNIRLKRDENVNRLHSPITSLSKSYRPFLTTRYPMIEIDVKSCHVSILVSLLKNIIEPIFFLRPIFDEVFDVSFSKHVVSIQNKLIQYPINDGQIRELTNVCWPDHQIVNPVIGRMISEIDGFEIEQELNIWNEALKGGKFYALFDTIARVKKPEYNQEERRDYIKEQYARYINSKRSSLTEHIKSNYPEIHELIQLLKAKKYKGKDGKDKFELGRQLMKVEAYLMIDVIAKLLCKKHRNLPIATIHDAIICPVHLDDEISDLIQEKWMDKLGLECKLKVNTFPTIVKG